MSQSLCLGEVRLEAMKLSALIYHGPQVVVAVVLTVDLIWGMLSEVPEHPKSGVHVLAYRM